MKPVLVGGGSPKKINMLKTPEINLKRLPDQIFWMKRERQKSESALHEKFLTFMKHDENIKFRTLTNSLVQISILQSQAKKFAQNP